MQNKNIIRFKFKKKDGLKYIAHLDLQRTVARIIKRSRIPVRYTEGFNPHPKMVFALPLSVGSESECELVDVYIVFDEKRVGEPLYTPEEFKRDITPNLPKGLDFVDAFYPDKPFTEIKSATYQVEADLKSEEDIVPLVKTILSSPIEVMKKSKAGDKVVDVSPLIFNFEVSQRAEKLFINLELSAAQNNYLNPEYIITGLKNNSTISEVLDYYTIKRTEIIFN